MNILNISIEDSLGAGRAAYFLHKNFISAGHNSKLLVLNKTADDDNVILYNEPVSQKIINRVSNKLRRKVPSDPNYYFFNKNERSNYLSTKVLLSLVPFRPDAIIIHSVSKFINARNIRELHLMTGAPIFWQGVDMAPLTGGCHYAWECTRYLAACGSCPAIYSEFDKDLTYQNLEYKRNQLRNTNLIFVAPTSNIEKQARQSSLFKDRPIRKIMLAVDNTIFRPFDKSAARDLLNIPKDKKIILFGSTSLKDERKGYKYLLESLNFFYDRITPLQREKYFCAIIGKNYNGEQFELPFESKCFGYFKDDLSLALAYQSADIFLSASIQDVGPMMINESIMCGTPVVSFEIGVAPDLVHTGLTGYRAELKNSLDLSKGILQVLDQSSEQHSQMSNNCRQMGLKLLHSSVQVESFLKLLSK